MRSFFLAALNDAGIKFYEECGVLEDMTVTEAKHLGIGANRGSILAFFDCTAQNYDPDINCYIFDKPFAEIEQTRAIEDLSLNEYSSLVNNAKKGTRRRVLSAIESCRERDPGPFADLR